MHGRKIAVIEVLGETLSSEAAEALAREKIGADATMVALDVHKGTQAMTRIFVEHKSFRVLRYGETAPLELRMRRTVRGDGPS